MEFYLNLQALVYIYKAESQDSDICIYKQTLNGYFPCCGKLKTKHYIQNSFCDWF